MNGLHQDERKNKSRFENFMNDSANSIQNWTWCATAKTTGFWLRGEALFC
jgi:hypothetical protein